MRQRPTHIGGLVSSAFRALGRLVHYLDLHEAPRAASAMAFDAFLSIIPLLAVAGWALHRLRDAVAGIEQTLASSPARALWWASIALFEALAAGDLPPDLETRKLCAK